MDKWNRLPGKSLVEETVENLKKRNINTFFVQTGKEAKEKVLELLPDGARVLATSSVTLETIGIKDAIDNSDKFISVRKEYMAFDREKEAEKIRHSRSVPDYVVGSVNAITKQGELLIASNTGSQITAYAGGAGKVIWVIGVQKIVDNLDEAMKRLNDYVVPLEEKHMQGLYGIGTNVSKLLIVNKEVTPGRATIIFVNESLGF